MNRREFLETSGMLIAACMVPINLLKQKLKEQPKEQPKKYFGELRYSGWDAENHGHNRHCFEMDSLPEEIHILPIATMDTQESKGLRWLGNESVYRTYWGVAIKNINDPEPTAQDLRSQHNLDAERELTGILAEEIQKEIDAEVMGKCKKRWRVQNRWSRAA